MRRALLAAPAAAILLIFVGGPLLALVRLSLYEEAGGDGLYKAGTWSIESYRNLSDAYTRSIVAFTVILGCSVALLVILLAYPLALWIHQYSGRTKAFLLALVLLPKLASVLVVLYGLQLLLGNTGPVNGLLVALGVFDRPRLLTHNRIGVMIAETYLLLPYAVLVLTTALDRIDPTLTAAARGLGAGPWQSFRRVTLPLSLPGLALAGQLSLVWALGALLGPLLLGGPDETTLAVEVQQQTLEKSNWPRGAAHAVLMLATLAVCLSIYAAPARLRKNS